MFGRTARRTALDIRVLGESLDPHTSIPYVRPCTPLKTKAQEAGGQVSQTASNGHLAKLFHAFSNVTMSSIPSNMQLVALTVAFIVAIVHLRWNTLEVNGSEVPVGGGGAQRMS